MASCGGAQQPDRMQRIGMLMGYAESDREGQAFVTAFGLQKLGWSEGRNIRMDTRWAKPDDAELMQRYAKELIALQPDLILSHGTPTVTWAPSKPPLHPSAWTRLQHLFATPPSSNPPLPRWHASRMAP